MKAALVTAGALAAEEVTRRALRESVGKAIVADKLQKRQEAPAAREVSFLEYKADPRPYETGELAGRKFSDHLSDYTGIEGNVGRTVMIDFKYQLAHMAATKINYINKHDSKDADDPALVSQTMQKLFSSYDAASATKTDLDGYEHVIDGALKEVRMHDLEPIRKLRAFKDLDDSQMALLKRIESVIDARMLLAYSATEIMPTQGAASSIGLDTYDFLLRNAGEQYVESIPAMHDSLLSYGPYQFTKKALEDSEGVKSGASAINRLLPQSQIPAHIGELRGSDHHKAAYLFALYNIAHLVKRLGPDTEKSHRAKKLLEHFDELPPDTVLEYIATAHHLPGNAMSAFEQFADAYVKSKEIHHAAHAGKKHKHDPFTPPSFQHYAAKHGLGEYCSKTKSNMDALRARQEVPQVAKSSL